MGKEFRSEENRAHSKVPKFEKEDASHYVEDARPGKTLYAHLFDRAGEIKNFKIYIGNLYEGDSIPVNIEVDSGEAKIEMNKSLSVGVNHFDSINVEGGDILFIKCRDMKDEQFVANTISIGFKVVREK